MVREVLNEQSVCTFRLAIELGAKVFVDHAKLQDRNREASSAFEYSLMNFVSFSFQPSCSLFNFSWSRSPEISAQFDRIFRTHLPEQECMPWIAALAGSLASCVLELVRGS